jgi:hypothetical protein
MGRPKGEGKALARDRHRERSEAIHAGAIIAKRATCPVRST